LHLPDVRTNRLKEGRFSGVTEVYWVGSTLSADMDAPLSTLL